jgi:HNH endonuclease
VAKYGPKPVPFAERMLKYIDVNGPVPAHRPELGPCHLWTGAKDKNGYGVTYAAGKVVRASRAVLELAVGPLANGQQALHRCDNPPCVRQSHLFSGTNLENHQDKARKGRSPIPWAKTHLQEVLRGADHPSAKLTSAQIAEIQREYVPRKKPLRYFAEKFGVGLTAIHWWVRKR